MAPNPTGFNNTRGTKAGHYVWDEVARRMVRMSDRPVRYIGVHNDLDAPFAARIRAGLRRQEEKGGVFAHSIKKMKSTWGN